MQTPWQVSRMPSSESLVQAHWFHSRVLALHYGEARRSRLDNGTGPHALNGKLDGLRQQRIEALQQKLKCDDILSLLRSSPNLRGFAVDDSDARMIASLYLHDLSDEANGKVIRCECHSHSSPVYGTSCCESLLVLPRVVVWMADLSQSMSSWASRQSPPSTSIPGGWAQSPPSS